MICKLPDLIALWGGLDDDLEGLAFGEGHALELLGTPGSIRKSVEDHLVLAIKPGVEVKSDVAGLCLRAAQINGKPVWQISTVQSGSAGADSKEKSGHTQNVHTISSRPFYLEITIYYVIIAFNMLPHLVMFKGARPLMVTDIPSLRLPEIGPM